MSNCDFRISEHHIRFLTSRVALDAKYKTLDLDGIKALVGSG
jgi:hypothetical protein